MKELEKLYASRATMSRHQQIKLMMQEFSLKKGTLKSYIQPRGLSLPTITLLKAVGNIPTTSPDQSTLDTSKTLPQVLSGDPMSISQFNISAGPPAHSRQLSSGPPVMDYVSGSHQLQNSKRDMRAVMGFRSLPGHQSVLLKPQKRNTTNTSKQSQDLVLLYQTAGLGGGQNLVMASSKDNLSIFEETKHHCPKVTKRSHTSINIGYNIYSKRLGKRSFS